MTSVGCEPAAGEQILADDVIHNFTIATDKPNTKKGGYQLKNGGDSAVGWVINHRLGELHTYTSKSPKSFTAEEKTAWREKMQAEKKCKDEQLAKVRREAAQQAQDIWAKASQTGDHHYLTRKQCSLNGARIHQGKLIIPIYKDGSMTSLQFISGDGDKMFLRGGEISGGWFPICTHTEPKDNIIVCEGFATGCSIRYATGFPVVLAFNAKNMIQVAKALKNKYPQSRIILAADNDEGKDINVGISCAQQAAAAIGGALVIAPDISGDWNDVHAAYGLEAVSLAFTKALTPTAPPDDAIPIDVYDEEIQKTLEQEWLDQAPPLEAYEEEARFTVALYAAGEKQESTTWRERLNYKVDGKLNNKSLNNAQLFIENDKVLGNLFCYDEFCHEKVLYRCPPWEKPDKFKPRTISDEDVTQLTLSLERMGIIQPFGNIARLLESTIRKNSRNPAREYFNGLKWDGIKRLDNWLIEYCGARFDDELYVQAVGRKWLTAAVARVFEPGCKFDHILIFEGKQNAGKSVMLRELATIHGRAYFNDTLKLSAFGNSDKIIMKLQGVVIIELQEMTSFDKMSEEEKKAILSTQSDIATLKYKNEAAVYPRQFVFAATRNPNEIGFLTDSTGGRRMWPVFTSDKIDIAKIKADKEQLWAEAVVAYQAGEELYLKDELYERAQIVQKDRALVHPWTPDLQDLVKGSFLDKIQDSDIWKKLEINDRTKRTRQTNSEISGIMTHLGFKRSRQRFGGEPEYCWVRVVPADKSQPETELDYDEAM